MAEYSMVNTNKNIIELVKKLFPFGYSVTGSENDRAAKLLQQILPFEFFEYPSGKELNGWVIPEGLEVQKAEIRKNGNLIYDAKKSQEIQKKKKKLIPTATFYPILCNS